MAKALPLELERRIIGCLIEQDATNDVIPPCKEDVIRAVAQTGEGFACNAVR